MTKPTYSPDGTPGGADWIKQSWDLPPYKSVEFYAIVPIESLDSFRMSNLYAMAVAKGLIHDDEWTADSYRVPE